jgi:hypothetical protein
VFVADDLGAWLTGVLADAGRKKLTDHLAVLDAAVAALLPRFRRRLMMITCDGAGASHDLTTGLDTLAARPGYQVIYNLPARTRSWRVQLACIDAAHRVHAWSRTPSAPRRTAASASSRPAPGQLGPGPLTSSPPGNASAPCRTLPDQHQTVPATKEGALGAL